MNKKTIINLILICFFLNNNNSNVFAQIQIPDSLRQYYNYIDSAEILIMDAKYVEAADYYQIAFSYKQKAFGVDIYNAAVCESKNKNYKNTYIYLKHLLRKGFGINSLKKKDCFQDFFDSRYGKKLLKKSLSITNNYNYEYREKLDSLKSVDNAFAQKYVDYVSQDKQYVDSLRAKSLYDSLNFIYKQNSIYLEKLIQNHGFPSEFIIGMDSISLTGQPYAIIIHHANKSFERKKGTINIINFTPYLNKAIEEGNIINSYAFDFLTDNKEVDLAKNFHLIRFALIPEYHTTPSQRHKMIIDKDSNLIITDWGYLKIDEEVSKKANKILTIYAMGSLESIRKKIVFSMNNKDFAFYKYKGSKDIYWLNEEQYKNSIKNLIIIE